MPIVIDATPGSPTANSYATIPEADAYHESVLDPSAWTGATEDEKARALVSATRLLEANLLWIGFVVNSEQVLSWPRYAARTRTGYLFPSNVIPQPVKDATAELARQLLAGTATPVAAANDLKSLKAGPVNLVFNEAATNSATPSLPDDVYQMVRFLASREGGANVRFVSVRRT